MKEVISIEQLKTLLRKHFAFDVVQDIQTVPGGYRCEHRSFTADGKRFFLKQYREGLHNTLDEVKRSEQFFATHQIPVILPIKNRDGQWACCEEGTWYSLFPFVEGEILPPSALTPHHVACMGKMHAVLHLVGHQADPELFSPMRFWDRETFLDDVRRVDDMIDTAQLETAEEQLAYQNLQLQAEFVRTHVSYPEDFGLENDCLLHGDYLYTNMFFDDRGAIRHLFDFERTGFAPRAYELARGMLISCFDDGWYEKNYEFARIYLKAYQSVYPISKEEFAKGIRMYITHFMHMSWMETAVLFGHTTSGPQHLVRPAHDRLIHFLGGVDGIIHELFVH